MYQEFYYFRNGENIVQKKNFYVPVNTKWLSRPEFREYILQIMQGECWNIRVVEQLPELIVNKTLYFLKNGNYYNIWVDVDDQRMNLPLDIGKHLYCHKICCDYSGRGEVNFVMYNDIPTSMTYFQINAELKIMGCTSGYKGYPASGENINGGFIHSIFAWGNNPYAFYGNFTSSDSRPLSDFSSTPYDVVTKIM